MNFSAARRSLLLYFGGLGLGLALSAPRLGWAETKLYLKDGTYQLVKSYEIRGSHVRYYSVERSAWEEIPKELVDFEATKKAAAEEEVTRKKDLEEAQEIAKERFEKPVETGPEIAPGIRLPQEEGVFAFDGERVIPMIQTSAEVVTDKKRAALLLALPGPLLKNRRLVVLPGAKAAVRIPAAQPTFFVHLPGNPNLGLIAAKSSKDSRVVEKIQAGLGAGKAGEARESLPLERATIAPGIVRLRPVGALTPGEYALGELLQEKLNLEVWDFGIEGGAKPAKSPASDRPPVFKREKPAH